MRNHFNFLRAGSNAIIHFPDVLLLIQYETRGRQKDSGKGDKGLRCGRAFAHRNRSYGITPSSIQEKEGKESMSFIANLDQDLTNLPVSQNFHFRYSLIAFAPFLPAPIARITVAEPDDVSAGEYSLFCCHTRVVVSHDVTSPVKQ